MQVSRKLLCLIPAITALALPVGAWAQSASASPSFSFGSGWQTKDRPALGLVMSASRGVRVDTSVLGAGPSFVPEQGSGLRYAAGVSYSFTPSISARLEWESIDFRLAGGTREPVRSTNLGLQFRY